MSSSSSPAAAPAASVVPLPGQETAVDVMNRSCPQENLAYKQCTDGFFSIDITTRLTTPGTSLSPEGDEWEGAETIPPADIPRLNNLNAHSHSSLLRSSPAPSPQ